MAPKEIGVAILGAGIFAREAHIPAIALISKSSHLKLEAVYSRSHSSAAGLAELAQKTLNLDSGLTSYSDDSNNGGLDGLLARTDIAAVIVVLPLVQQPEIIIKAFKAGKHVLSEKPIAKDVASALELIKTYETEYQPKGIVWRVAENFECEPGIQAARDIIKSGKIGKVALFRLTAVGYIDTDNKWYKTSWRTVPDYQGGFLLDGGVHSAALLRTILPGKISSLTGFASLTKEFLGPHDSIQSVLQLSEGAHGIFELTFAAPSQERCESLTTVTGTEGHLEIKTEKRDDVQHYAIKVVDKAGKADTQYFRVQGVEKEIEYFVKAINKEEDPNVEATGSPRGALRDVAVIQAGLTSQGQLVDISKLVAEV